MREPALDWHGELARDGTAGRHGHADQAGEANTDAIEDLKARPSLGGSGGGSEHDQGDRLRRSTSLRLSPSFRSYRSPLLAGLVGLGLCFYAPTQVAARAISERYDPTSAVRHDGPGRVVETRDALGNRVEEEHDPNGNPTLIREVEASGLGAPETFLTRLTYDRLNRLSESTDELGHTTRMGFDARDLMVSATDARGPLTGATNDPGNEVRQVYDRAGRHLRTEIALHQGGTSAGSLETTIVLATEYDRNSRPKRHTDGRGNETSYQHDDLDRVERVRLADATEWSYLHDGDGNLLQSLDPNGSLVTRRYDGLSRALEVTVVPGAGVEGTRRQSFAWDGLSRSLELVDDNGSSVGPVGSTGLVAVASLLEQRWDSLSRPLCWPRQ